MKIYIFEHFSSFAYNYEICHNFVEDTERRKMLNQVILSGVVKEVPQIKETANGVHYANLLLEVKKEFKNSEGVYEKELYSVLMWRAVADQCVTLCEQGDIVTVKGRLQSSLYNREDGNVFFNYEIIADKIFCMR